jgi:hypothetical protein
MKNSNRDKVLLQLSCHLVCKVLNYDYLLTYFVVRKKNMTIHPVREYNQDLERKAGLILYEVLGQKQTSKLFNAIDNC